MKSDITESVIATCIIDAAMLKIVNQDLQSLTNLKRSLEEQILTRYQTFGIGEDAVKGIAIKEVPISKPRSFKEVLDAFPNSDIRVILENLVGSIYIDLAKTKENLHYSGQFQEPIIKGIMKQLTKLSEETEKRVEVK